jgi:hypothetical protein
VSEDMPVEKEGTQSIPIIEDSELVLRLGTLAPIYAGKKPTDSKWPAARFILHPDGEWCKLQDYCCATIMNNQELDVYSRSDGHKLYFAGENQNGILEFHLYEKR